MATQQLPCTRRTFIKTVAGVSFTVNLLPFSAFATATKATQPTADLPGWEKKPGQARYRIDGMAKVTGQKIYPRDFQVCDMPGWPDKHLEVLVVRATNTINPFQKLDFTSLPEGDHPVHVLYGDNLNQRVNHHSLGKQSNIPAGVINYLPGLVEHAYIVPRGEAASYFGQPTAFLFYNDAGTCRRVKEKLRTGTVIQHYNQSKTVKPANGIQGQTYFVRIKGQGNEDEFSFFKNGQDSNYTRQARQTAQTIASQIESSRWKTYKTHCRMSAMDPMFMEPESGLGWYDASTQTLHLLVGTQSPGDDAENLATIFSNPHTPIVVKTINMYCCYLGGAFGGRDRTMVLLNLALAAAYSKGIPVRLANNRYEQFQCGIKRHGTTIQEQIAVDQNGLFQAQQVDIQLDGGGRKIFSAYVSLVAALGSGGAYAIPRAAIRSKAFYSTNIMTGAQRGFGGPQGFFATETLIDDIARDQNIDPFDLREKNLLKRGSRIVSGDPIVQELRLEDILRQARQHPFWKDRQKTRKHWQTQNRLYGVGFALSMQPYGTGADSVMAEVELKENGSLAVTSDAVDMGNGSATTLALATAKILGSNAGEVIMGQSDLFDRFAMKAGGKADWENPEWTQDSVSSSGACRTASHQTHAVQQASQVLLDTSIIPAALTLWKIASQPERLIWKNEKLTAPDTDLKPLSLKNLAHHIFQSNDINRASIHGFYQTCWVEADYQVNNKRYHWAIDGLVVQKAHATEPEIIRRQSARYPSKQDQRFIRTLFSPCGNLIGLTVNPASGHVEIQKSVTILNAGTVLCEPLVSGQSQGGVAMAIGYTLMEQIPQGMSGPAGGHWNLNKYHVPRANNVPLKNIQLKTLPPETGNTPGRGIAEAVMCSVPAAISNALMDATGQRFTDLPITPAIIKAAIHNKKT